MRLPLAPIPFEQACLILENGTRFHGMAPSWQQQPFFGEVVFTTGMTGYPESLTDPSYAGQILTFTFPLIGNWGVPDKQHWESTKIHAKGVVVSHACTHWSHHTGLMSLTEWLKCQNVPLITSIDTRELTKTLRQKGTMAGAIVNAQIQAPKFPSHENTHWVSHVSIKNHQSYNSGKKTIIAVDCGMKENIIRSLQCLNATIKRVPHDYDYTHEPYDGIFLSNGPGDPTTCVKTIDILKKAIAIEKPIFGICLGAQLLALAAGGSTYKLPFGHRGQNQPCIDLETKRCYITSQNHGYAVAAESLPSNWIVSFKNLNDGSVEGIRHKTKPYFAVQFHPEASPGPTDTLWLFNKFYEYLTYG